MGPSKDLNLMEEGEASRTRLLDSDNNVAHSNDVVIFNTMFVNISTILYIFAFFKESVLNILDDFALYGLSILKSLILKRYKIHLRNRFVLAVICCLIYHCQEVSRLKWIKSRARSASDLSTYD